LQKTSTFKRSPPSKPTFQAKPVKIAIPRVLNKKRDKITEGSVLVGRPTKWGNPFVLGVDGSRDEVIEKYRLWLLKSTLMDDLHELQGRDLICWCAPLRCHGDILLDLANGGTRYMATEVFG
jgi:hypothetical protein